MKNDEPPALKIKYHFRTEMYLDNQGRQIAVETNINTGACYFFGLGQIQGNVPVQVTGMPPGNVPVNETFKFPIMQTKNGFQEVPDVGIAFEKYDEAMQAGRVVAVTEIEAKVRASVEAQIKMQQAQAQKIVVPGKELVH